MEAEPTRVDVQISLVNTDNAELLRRCLASLPAAAGAITWRASVVDNASRDGSGEVVRREFPWARLLENGGRLGFSANHNQIIGDVIGHDSARYVLVLNEDTELEPGSLEQLVSFADREDRLGAAGPRLVEKDGRDQVSYFRFPGVVEQFWSTLRPGRPPHRVEGAGWRSAVCESSRVVHHGHQAVSQSGVGTYMEQQMLRSRYLYFRKHHGGYKAALVVALIRVALGVRAAKALLTGAVTGDGGERNLAGLLWSLARYDPVAPLPHESMSTGALS